MKPAATMPERTRAHIHWLEGLSWPRRLLHWVHSGYCPECQWRRAGRHALQSVLDGEKDGAATGVAQETLAEHPDGLDAPKWLR
jgi:hypothetical protein